MTASQALLEVRDLAKHFTVTKGSPRPVTTTVRAVAGVSFAVTRGEAFGLVGESGCGKSTAARALLRLIPPDAGRVRFADIDVTGAHGSTLQRLRRRMQIVFQDPYSSLNPRRTIGQALTEPLGVHGRAARERAIALLEEVGLPPSAYDRHPHEFSGGQRQRVGIARAPVCRTRTDRCRRAGFRTRRLGSGTGAPAAERPASTARPDLRVRQSRSRVVWWFCSRVAVMYLGRVVESGPVARVFGAPHHPYTRMPRDASRIPDPGLRGQMQRIVSEIPSAANPPAGCHFHPRCPRASDVCRTVYPEWRADDDWGCGLSPSRGLISVSDRWRMFGVAPASRVL